MGAAGALTAASYSRVLGANDRIGLGLVGCGGRGSYDLELFLKEPGVEARALCDVWARRIAEARAKAPNAEGYGDHRKLLDNKDVDVVLIATPDHWHCEIAIDAMNAGKDVYVEKPLTYRREEGPRVVRAARVNQRVCQVGLQQRSGPQYMKVRDEYVRKGKLGQVTYVHSWWSGGMPRRLRLPTTEKPPDLDWARYLGQVKWRDWNPAQYFHYRAFLDFGGGKLTDLFTHWIDAIHMMMDNDATTAVMVAGGVYHKHEDGRDAPDTFTVTAEYRGPYTVSFESPAVPINPGYGIELCGTEGRMYVDRNRLEFRSHEKGAQPVVERIAGDITADHIRNFLECCRSRKEPNCGPYQGHRGSQAALLAVQAYVEKRRIVFDPDREVVL